jgi:endonuclease/exonuclease/phosphatase family metal-dependent hydrolase
MEIQRAFGKMLLILSATILISCFSLSPAWAGKQASTIKVMTRNMYPGANLGIIATAQDAQGLNEAVTIITQQVIDSRIPERASLIAAEIVENRPDLIALQEVTRWKINGVHGMIVFDQLELLMDSLRESGQHYRVVALQRLTDVQMKGLIGYTDHNVILLRSDSAWNVIASEAHLFNTLMSFPTLNGELQVLRGWMAVNVKRGDFQFKFVATHLEAPLPEMPETQQLQFYQAVQLVEDLSTSKRPVILAGDFNSDAEPTPGYPPDKTESYGYILRSGYNDPWHQWHASDDYGYTWPLVDEYSGQKTDPVERIDLILSDGIDASAIEQTGMIPTRGLCASDHAGVVAAFAIAGNSLDRH